MASDEDLGLAMVTGTTLARAHAGEILKKYRLRSGEITYLFQCGNENSLEASYDLRPSIFSRRRPHHHGLVDDDRHAGANFATDD
jgi:hypothetical protein